MDKVLIRKLWRKTGGVMYRNVHITSKSMT
nr:MAG TPA: hypothetical protein [Caudoviricetes sp.]